MLSSSPSMMALVSLLRTQFSWCASNETTAVGCPPTKRMVSSSGSLKWRMRGSISNCAASLSITDLCSKPYAESRVVLRRRSTSPLRYAPSTSEASWRESCCKNSSMLKSGTISLSSRTASACSVSPRILSPIPPAASPATPKKAEKPRMNAESDAKLNVFSQKDGGFTTTAFVAVASCGACCAPRSPPLSAERTAEASDAASSNSRA
mmetsp:Transcript_45282/g.105740  ORF Transcript_45282/g.105740 Transcript_45282/m.105740 type:complete len:208 (-) Transcript_45282:426-1049(-)